MAGSGISHVAAMRYGTFETTLLFVSERTFHLIRILLDGLAAVKLRGIRHCNFEGRVLLRRHPGR
jgi:hypothetical protein